MVATANLLNITNPQTQEVITAAERASANIKLGCGLCFDSITASAEVTGRKTHPLVKAREYLQRARGHWSRAKAQGASPEQLEALEGFGRAAAKAVAEAEARVERVRRALILKGMNVREVVRHVAEALVDAGKAEDVARGVQMIAEHVDPRTAREEDVLAVWMQLLP